MSIYHLTEEHQLFQAAIKKWTEQQLAPHIKHMEEHRRVPEHLLPSLASLGFLNATLPVSLGGLDEDITWNVLLLEEIAKAGSTGFAQIIKQHAALALPLLVTYLDQAPLAQQCLDQHIQCTYVQIRAHQQQALVVNAQHARYVIIHHIDLHQLALIDLQKGHYTATDDLVGWSTAQMAYVPLQQPPIKTVHLSKEQSYTIQATNDVLDAAIFFGIAQTAYNQTKNYAKTRIQFDGPLTQFQVVRHYLVDMKINVEKLRHLLYVAAFTPQPALFIQQCFALRLFVQRIVHPITDFAIQLHGGNGFMMEYDAQRFWRDSKMYNILCEETSYDAKEIGQLLYAQKITN